MRAYAPPLLLLLLFFCLGSPADKTVAEARALAAGEQASLFRADVCNFVSPTEIQRLLGADVASVTAVPAPVVPPGTCIRDFRVDLTDGRNYHLEFDIRPASPEELTTKTISFEANARIMSDLIKYETSTDRVTQLASDLEQHRLYVLNPSAATLPTLTYYSSLGDGGQPPHQSEARRRSAVRLLNYLLTHQTPVGE